MYLNVSAETFNSRTSPLSKQAISEAIAASLTSLYGVVGGATLLYEEIQRDNTAGNTILRIPIEHCSRVWAAITLIHSVGENPARFTVESATPFLFALERSGT